MGSRAVVVACRDAAVAKTRFGVANRRGRSGGDAHKAVASSPTRKIEIEVLDRLRAALGTSGFWDEHKTDWASSTAS